MATVLEGAPCAEHNDARDADNRARYEAGRHVVEFDVVGALGDVDAQKSAVELVDRHLASVHSGAPALLVGDGNEERLSRWASKEALTWPGVYYVRTWMNEGELGVGDSIMYVLIGADIRPNCVDALQKLVGKIKNELVVEKEIYA